MYSFNSKSSDIKFVENITNIKDNDFYYKMSPLTVYMFEFYGSDTIEEDKTTTDVTTDNSEVTEENSVSEPAETTVGSSASEETVLVTPEVSEEVSSNHGHQSESSTDTPKEHKTDNASVPIVFKVIVSALVAAVIVVMIYTFIFDKTKLK